MSSESISVVLPVQDAESWLASQTEDLLDCLSDLTQHFQVILVDDASKDFTAEIIDELRRQFPQVVSIRFSQAKGGAAAVQAGIEQAKGDFIFVQEDVAPIRISDLQRLWLLRSDRQLVMARAQTSARRIDENLMQRLFQWGKKVTEQWEEPKRYTGLQMLRRSHLRMLQGNDASQHLEVAHISHQALAGPNYDVQAPTRSGRPALKSTEA